MCVDPKGDGSFPNCQAKAYSSDVAARRIEPGPELAVSILWGSKL